jgi:hypothetical protein
MKIGEILNTLKYYRGALPNHPIIQEIAWRLTQAISSIGGRKYRGDFETAEKFCLFVGHGRSGHSLVGSCLDAHPHMVISHELNALDFVQNGVTKLQLFYLLLARSRWFARQNANWNKYNYSVPNQHKGDYDSLRVIGDKKGGGTSSVLSKTPDLIDKLRKTVKVPVHVIHVTRHPLDNISSMARKDCDGDIDKAIKLYFNLFEGVRQAKNRTCEDNWFEISCERFIRNTDSSLRDMCNFMDVTCTQKYIDNCSKLVFDKPSRSRSKVTYSRDQKDRIRQRFSEIPSLHRYINSFS